MNSSLAVVYAIIVKKLYKKQMRILMLGVKEFPYGISAKYENFPGGGTARYVISISEKLADKGFIVHLVVRKMPGQLRKESLGNLIIHRVFWINNKYLRWPSFSIATFFRSIFIAGKVDLIHTHGSFDAFFGVILARLFKKKIIGTPHGLTSFQAKGKYNVITVKLTYFLEKISFKSLDKIIFLSEAEKNTVKEKLRLDHLNYEIVNMGIEPIKLIRKKSNKFKIIFIGRLVYIKGIDRLINSLNFIPAEILKNVELNIIGEGFIRKELEEHVRRNNLGQYVNFTGFTTMISPYLQDASLFVLPSHGGEGLPVALLEAMSAGVPCMISNFDSPFSDQGIISLKNNEPQTIADKIVYYYNHTSELDDVGKHGMSEFNDMFSMEKVIENFIKIYHIRPNEV